MSEIVWRIYFDDGSTFDNTQGEPEDAQARGVLIVAQVNETTNVLRLYGFDWYWYRQDEKSWYGGDIFGLLDQFMRYPRECTAIKQGRTVLQFEPYMTKAIKDADFAQASGGRHIMENKKRDLPEV